MIKTSIEKMSRDIGFDIGNSDDQVQADLLNGFADALCKLQKRDTEMQCCYIHDKLTTNAKNIISTLHDFTLLENKEQT